MAAIPLINGDTSNNYLTVIGFDPSLRNWGIATGKYHLNTEALELTSVDIVQPKLLEGKQVRQNSSDVNAAKQLFEGAYSHIKGISTPIMCFAEIPVGSQSARAMASYGVCAGVIGSLESLGVPIIEVTPKEVKLATGNSKTATKSEMIAWATNTHPALNWPMTKASGASVVNASKAEHMADAVACIYAGLRTKEFRVFLNLLQSMQQKP
jgi:hypothetical protein